MALCDKEWIMASTVRSETEEFPKPAVQRIYGDVSFLSHWAFMLITLCVNVRLTVFHFYQSYINFNFFLIYYDEVDCLLFCFFIAYCFSVFYPFVTSPVFWWWVWISPRSAYQRYPAPVTFFCLSLSLFRTVNLKMYNISLSPHLWEFFEFNN